VVTKVETMNFTASEFDIPAAYTKRGEVIASGTAAP
jgi:hypothetical protein